MVEIVVNNRLSLRQVELSDAGAIFGLIDAHRDFLRTWLPFVDYTRRMEDTEAYISSIYNVHDVEPELVFVMVYDGITVGLVGFKDSDRVNQKSEIGYWISESYQKRGIVTESVKVLVTYAFNTLGMNRVQILCGVGNIPSRSIPRRLGFTLEGIVRDGELLSNGIFIDLEMYSVLKREWLIN